MALDPSIALQFNNPTEANSPMAGYTAGINNANTMQNISRSQTQQANEAAQLPGLQADSAVKQRALAFNSWLQDNGDKFVNADGSRDVLALTNAATTAGFNNEALSLAASDLKNKSALIGNATDQQDQSIKKADFVNSGAGHISNMLSDPTLTDAQKSALLQKSTQYLDGLLPGTGTQVMGLLSKTVPVLDSKGQPIPKTNPDGTPVLDENGKPVPQTTIAVDPEAVKNVARATQDLNTQFQNAQAKQKQDAALQASFKTPEGQATTGPLVNAAYAAIRANGIGEDRVPNGLSLFQLHQLHYLDDVIGKSVLNNQVPIGTRLDYQNRAFGNQLDINKVDTAIQAASKMPTQLLGTKPGSIVSGAFQHWVEQNPQYAALQTAIQTHNTNYPQDQIDPSKMNVGEILAKLQVTRDNLQKDYAVNTKAAQTTQLPGQSAQPGNNAIPSPALPPGITPQTPAPGGGNPAGGVAPSAPRQQPAPQGQGSKPVVRADGKVLMINPAGKSFYVAPSDVPEAQRNNWKVATK